MECLCPFFCPVSSQSLFRLLVFKLVGLFHTSYQIKIFTDRHYTSSLSLSHKRAHRWRRHALPFALVVWCRKRAQCHPAHLDGSQFLSPSISKHLRWMKGRLRARAFFNSRHSSSQSSGVEPFGGVSRSILDGFLRSDVHFLQLPRLLSQF